MSRQNAVLREMGLAPLWRLRSAVDPVDAAEAPATRQPADVRPAQVQPPAVAAPDPRPAATAVRTRPAVVPVPTESAARPQAVPDVSGLGWDALEQQIRDCRACALCERRTQAVPGVGDREADWLIVGEGPGAEEDQRGEPFVGQAGKLLDAMLAAIGLRRGHNVYIANAVKCRPPGNRTPEADEMATCQPYLERQIALIKPRIIVALGRPAAQTLLGGEVKIAAARGRLFDRNGIPVVVTYHPAYLLRNPQDKAKAWEDLCFARASVL